MSAKVSNIRVHSAPQQGAIDIRDEQKILLEAEAACLAALEKCSNANMGFVSFLRKTETHITQARARQLLGQAKQTMNFAFELSESISSSHRMAQGIVEMKTNTEVLLSGGTGKDETGTVEYFEAQT